MNYPTDGGIRILQDMVRSLAAAAAASPPAASPMLFLQPPSLLSPSLSLCSPSPSSSSCPACLSPHSLHCSSKAPSSAPLHRHSCLPCSASAQPAASSLFASMLANPFLRMRHESTARPSGMAGVAAGRRMKGRNSALSGHDRMRTIVRGSGEGREGSQTVLKEVEYDELEHARSQTEREDGRFLGIGRESIFDNSFLSAWGPWMLLNFITILWGSQHAIIKLTLEDDAGSPALLNLLRFALATMVFLPFAPGISSFGKKPPQAPLADEQEQEIVGEGEGEQALLAVGTEEQTNGKDRVNEDAKSSLWRSGVELGLWTFAGYATQSIGLQYTTASRSAFLLYLNVKLVPILGLLLYRKQVSFNTWCNVALALLGTFLVGYDGGTPNVGDAWSVAAAASSAMFILRLEGAARRHEAAELNAISMMTATTLCLLWVLLFERAEDMHLGPQQLLAASYLGLVTTALTSFLQTIGQKSINAESAAIIYAMDPVYAAIFSFLLLGETMGAQGIAGGALLFAAAILNISLEDKKDDKSEQASQ